MPHQEEQSPVSARYKVWRKRFLRRRLRLSIHLALIAYLTFITLELILISLGVSPRHPTWLLMAGATEVGLLISLVLLRLPVGQRSPEWVFLACSWSITLIEQVWATLRGVAFPGVFAWTLVFLAQATLMPVRWQLHMVSQIGVLLYYFTVNTILGLPEEKPGVWDSSLWLYLFWFCCICNLSIFLYEQLQQAEFHARQELEEEQKKSERLLLNILPEAVARQLKQEHRTIAESFAEATVLFADIVGFTELSSNVPPQEMVTLLNQIFSKFDRLAEHHGLEKIKTIGDSYMVVGGLPIEREDHVEAIAEMALDMLEAIAEFNSTRSRPFNIRVGINTGPVVAGVIGVKKFIYDLWGDTVNVASRMESQGLPGRIQVTSAIYERLKHRYEFQPRGDIYVKGKGEMMVYLLMARKQAESEGKARDEG
ncbi:adenylate/guanylate cyclase domain-containing protein [Oscillatoria sp. FACHB-1407]|uniref:adenylate/guanylate cyclase domain-containing protein n=1 Tax=Oscillatoria sp. FACHB-1407 TaxID=2692847 RepID=UPI0016833A4B|nr:adenylate/guanylate cyclase domain-containing protein [Oscillatoria sp. FACHB-1407]MBD2462440.1 adenylate/guanylate cyclase domain-containing protein [Oscillatoria sp. FACHB-1407]